MTGISDNQTQALINALKTSMQPQGGLGGALSGAAGLLTAATAAHRKNNPTLYDKSGAFQWSQAMKPNQGWQTTAQDANGANVPMPQPQSIYGQMQAAGAPKPWMGGAFGAGMGA